MKVIYPVLFYEEENNEYSVFVPFRRGYVYGSRFNCRFNIRFIRR